MQRQQRGFRETPPESNGGEGVGGAHRSSLPYAQIYRGMPPRENMSPAQMTAADQLAAGMLAVFGTHTRGDTIRPLAELVPDHNTLNTLTRATGQQHIGAMHGEAPP